MKILFISHQYPPSTGGMERQSFHLVEGMKAYAFTLQLVYTGAEPKLRFYLGLKRRVKKTLSDHTDIDLIHYYSSKISIYSLNTSSSKSPWMCSNIFSLSAAPCADAPSIAYSNHLARITFRKDT